MSKFKAFRNRMNAGGKTHQESVMNLTRRKAYNYIMNSPSRSEVEVYSLDNIGMDELALESSGKRYAIISDKETFHKRIALFLPSEGVKTGTYLKYDGKMYLATDISDVDGYPQAFIDYCNHNLTLEGKESRVKVGENHLGAPIYKTTKPVYSLPAHFTTKIYSVLDNSPIPLPTGSILIYLPYHEDINIYVNYEFDFMNSRYKMTTINSTNVLTDAEGKKFGFYEIRSQEIQKEGA